MANVLLAIPSNIIPNIDRAPVLLNGLLFENIYVNSKEIAKKLLMTYSGQLTRYCLFVRNSDSSIVYRILGSTEILGNPVGVLHNFGVGVKDFFYEPAKGFVVSPKEFIKGVGKVN